MKASYAWPIAAGIGIALLVLQLFPDFLSPDNPPGRHHHGSGPVSYAQAVDHARYAVVNIYTAKIVTRRLHPLLDDPFFRRFFGQQAVPQRERIQASLGSGVIVDPRGYLLTNNHVIADADEIKVALIDGREALATVIGVDADTDLAVLKIDVENAPSIELSASDRMRVGDVVLAIGNPFGFGQSVSMGIVSATGRHQLGLSAFEDFIQTDAAINQGNSGGALINARGELIGISTAIISRSGGSDGIGFAIPAKLAKEVMSSIIRFGRVVRGWLGIETQALTPKLAASLNSPVDISGIVITGVYRNSPAHWAGLQPGDIITQIDRTPVSSDRQAMNLIAAAKPEDKVSIVVYRNGQMLKIPTQIGERRNEP